MKRWLIAPLVLAALCLSAGAGLADGVVNDAGTARDVSYSINNFTPYRFVLRRANQSLDQAAVLPVGIPSSLEAIDANGESAFAEEGASASLEVVYLEDHEDIWSPVYQMEMRGQGSPVYFTLKNDVERTGTAYLSMEQLDIGEVLFSRAIETFGGAMYSADLARCRRQQMEMREAVRDDNRIDNAERRVVTLATSPEGDAVPLLMKNDRAELLIGGDLGESLVLQTLAVRLPEKLEYESYDAAAQTGMFGFDRTSQPRLLSGGRARTVVNLYTHAQYCTLNALLLAGRAEVQTEKERELVAFVLGDRTATGISMPLTTDASPVWENSSVFAAQTAGMTEDAFYSRMKAISQDDRVNVIWKALESLVPEYNRDGIATAASVDTAQRKLGSGFAGGFFSGNDSAFADGVWGMENEDFWDGNQSWIDHDSAKQKELIEKAIALLEDAEDDLFIDGGFEADRNTERGGGWNAFP